MTYKDYKEYAESLTDLHAWLPERIIKEQYNEFDFIGFLKKM